MADQLDYHISILSDPQQSDADRLLAANAVFIISRERSITRSQILLITSIDTQQIVDYQLKYRLSLVSQFVWPQEQYSPLSIALQNRPDFRIITPELRGCIEAVGLQLEVNPALHSRTDIQQLIGQLSLALPKSAEGAAIFSGECLKILSDYLAAAINEQIEDGKERISGALLELGSFEPSAAQKSIAAKALRQINPEHREKWYWWLMEETEDDLSTQRRKNLLQYFVKDANITKDVEMHVMANAMSGIPLRAEEKTLMDDEILENHQDLDEFVQGLFVRNAYVFFDVRKMAGSHDPGFTSFLQRNQDCFSHLALPIPEKLGTAIEANSITREEILAASQYKGDTGNDIIEWFEEDFLPFFRKLQDMNVHISYVGSDTSLEGELRRNQELHHLSAIQKQDRCAKIAAVNIGFFYYSMRPENFPPLLRERLPETDSAVFALFDWDNKWREFGEDDEIKDACERLHIRSSFAISTNKTPVINNLGDFDGYDGIGVFVSNDDDDRAKEHPTDPTENIPVDSPKKKLILA